MVQITSHCEVYKFKSTIQRQLLLVWVKLSRGLGRS